MWSRVLLVVLICFCGNWGAIAQPRYFGYYASNGAAAEVSDHVNVVHIGTWTNDRVVATDTIINELSAARAQGLKAIVAVDAFLFGKATSSTGRFDCPYRVEMNAPVYWTQFVDRLVAEGYVNPVNPSASTVIAFYPVDEPEDCGLADQNSQAHPALVNAINVIKADYRTSAIPVAVISSKRYGSTIRGLRLFDWTGLDCYGCYDSSLSPARFLWGPKANAYLDASRKFWSDINKPTQRRILIPQAAAGGFMEDYGFPHDPVTIYTNGFLSDPKVVLLLPFLWKHGGTNGVSVLPDLKADYNTIGQMIRNDSQLVRQTVPATMVAGQTYAVSFTFRNTGTTTWGANHKLRQISSSWGVPYVALPSTTPGGAEVTFNFNVVAPSMSGNFGFQWQLEHDGIVFGAPSNTVFVTVYGDDSSGGIGGGGYCDPQTRICYQEP